MARLRLVLKTLAGAGVVCGVGFGIHAQSTRHEDDTTGLASPVRVLAGHLTKKPVHASWTTGFEPSVKWDSNWDKRDPKSLTKPQGKNETEDDYKNRIKQNKPSKYRILYLIRHGQYNLDGSTDFDRTLTELGREQAALTGQRLKELNIPYTVMVNSSMTRARETADIINKNLHEVPRKTCDLLREGAPIPPEPPVGHWRPEVHEFYEDGMRIEAAFRKYFHRADVDKKEDSHEVIVCHANVIRYFVCRALQLPPEAWLRISLRHASITCVRISPSGNVTLRYLGDAGHMPPEKLSTV